MIRSLPSGLTYLDHVFRGRMTCTINGTSNLISPGLYFTTQSRHEDVSINYESDIGFISAEFYPTAIYRLLGVPMGNYSKVNVEWSKLIGQKRAKSMSAYSLQARTKNTCKTAFDEMFYSLLLNALPAVDKIDAAVRIINEAEGRVKISDLCGQLFMTQCTLTRKFSSVTGFTPKFYSSIVQVNSMLVRMYTDKASPEQGYFDHVYFNKSFQKYFDVSPQKYRDFSNAELHQLMGRERYCSNESKD